MKVFKLFFKLLLAYRLQLSIGLALLFAITIPLSSVYRNNLTEQFQMIELDIGIINHDSDSTVSQHFVDYLDQNSIIQPIKASPEEIADALYYEDVLYVIEIPQGWGNNLLTGPDAYLPLRKSAGASAEVEAFGDILVNNYVQNFQILSATITDKNNDQQVSNMLADLGDSFNNETAVFSSKNEMSPDVIAYGASYTHMASYVQIMTFITAFGLAIISMRNPEIVKRDWLSQMTETTRLRQTWLACITFSMGFWFIIILAAILIYGSESIFSYHGLYLTLSSFVAMFGIQAMAYFLVTISRNKGMVTFLASFVSLFIAFTSGLFAPREFIAPIMQQFASLATPIWQVKADEIILSTQILTPDQMGQLYRIFGIQILLGAVYYMLSFIIQKYRQNNAVYMG